LRNAEEAARADNPNAIAGSTIGGSHATVDGDAGIGEEPSMGAHIAGLNGRALEQGARDSDEHPCDNDRSSFEHDLPLPNGPRLSCGALKKNSFPNLRAPTSFKRWLGSGFVTHWRSKAITEGNCSVDGRSEARMILGGIPEYVVRQAVVVLTDTILWLPVTALQSRQ